MRLFQNCGLYSGYLPRLDALCQTNGSISFTGRLRTFLHDRYGASHILLPVMERQPSAFLTNGDDETLQRFWAKENGMPSHATLENILVAQIEHHRTEIFYNMDPMRYSGRFLRKLPACVRVKMAWRAAPSPGADFGGFDLILCNFPTILKSYEDRGWRAAYFTPAHDPEMDPFGENRDRPVDVVFSGGYGQHHLARARTLDKVAKLASRASVAFYLECSRLTRLAESAVGHVLPLGRYRRPLNIRAINRPAVFGRQLYTEMSRSKIVLNGAVDMAGNDRGNMRCFEALGCGAVLVSDAGNYPDGFVEGESILTYRTADEACDVIMSTLSDKSRLAAISANGVRVAQQLYGKRSQWTKFAALVDDVA